MKIWITKNSEIPVRDQIVSQVRVAIASGDLRPGDKLPSTRELARRFSIHANTVSAAYRELAATGAVDLRKGSGIYIRENGHDRLDDLIERLFLDAARSGFSRDTVLERMLSGLSRKVIRGFALFEENDALAEIIAHEIRQSCGIKVERVTKEGDRHPGSVLVALFDEEPKVRSAFGNEDCIFLNPNSVASSLVGRARPRPDELVAVASGWEDFLRLSRLFLLAAGVDAQSICICSTAEAGWKRPLATASMIICDSVTATELYDDRRVVVFPVVSTDSLNELNRTMLGNAVAPSESIPTM
jgi:DNA-binding transcriptional regulator YhcF (GntR family)